MSGQPAGMGGQQQATQNAQQAQAPAAQRKPQLKPVHDVHIDELLEIVVANNASDLHLAVGLPPVMRIDGALRKTRYEALGPAP